MACRGSAQFRKMNCNLVRKVMPEREFWIKETLSSATGLSQATCHSILMEMLKTGEVEELSLAEPEGGRPARRFHYNTDYFRFGFIRLQSQNLQKSVAVRITNAAGNVIREEAFRMDEIPLSRLLSIIEDTFKNCPGLCGLGISYQGVVCNGKTGGWSCMEELNGLDLAGEIRQRFPLPLVIENDVNLAAWGYFQAHAQETDSLAYIAFPKANLCGCGLISDGRLLRGSRGFAGEILYIQNQTWEEQRRRLNRPRGRADVALRLIRPLTALFDPERIVISGDEIPAEDIRHIQEQCRMMLRSDFLPPLHFLPDYATDNFRGLFELVRQEFYHLIETGHTPQGNLWKGEKEI